MSSTGFICTYFTWGKMCTKRYSKTKQGIYIFAKSSFPLCLCCYFLPGKMPQYPIPIKNDNSLFHIYKKRYTKKNSTKKTSSYTTQPLPFCTIFKNTKPLIQLLFFVRLSFSNTFHKYIFHKIK